MDKRKWRKNRIKGNFDNGESTSERKVEWRGGAEEEEEDDTEKKL
jgi:hypothetical protein